MASRTCRRAAASSRFQPWGYPPPFLAGSSRESGSVADTLAGRPRRRGPGRRPAGPGRWPGSCGSGRSGRSGRPGPASCPPRPSRRATAAWYLGHHGGLGVLGPGQPLPGAAHRVPGGGDPGVRAAPARPAARRACPAPRAAGPAGRPSRPAGGARRRPAPAAVIIIIIVVRQPLLAARAVRPGRAGQPRLRLGVDRGLQRGDLRSQLLPRPGSRTGTRSRTPGTRPPRPGARRWRPRPPAATAPARTAA